MKKLTEVELPWTSYVLAAATVVVVLTSAMPQEAPRQDCRQSIYDCGYGDNGTNGDQ